MLKLDRSKLVKNLGSNNKLVPYLEKAIGQEEFGWEFVYEPKGKDDAFHPSGDCTIPVAQLLDIVKERLTFGKPDEDKVATSLRKSYVVGHFWHQYLQTLVQRMGFADEDNIERVGVKKWDTHGHALSEDDIAKPFHWVRGAADIAPVTVPKYGDFLVDFKTMKTSDFSSSGLPEWAAAKYEAQINIYMDFFDLERALIVCIQKDSPHELREVEFKRNQPLVDEIYRRWKLVSHALETNTELDDDREVSLPLLGPVQ